MTKQEYFEFSEEFFKNCIETSKKKNSDYTGGSEDPFSNFKSVETLGISTEVGFLTRMMDKMKRISSFVENGTLQVKDESVTDTLQDLANYSCLLAGYIKSKGKFLYYDLASLPKGMTMEDVLKEYKETGEVTIAVIENGKIVHKKIRNNQI